MSGLKRIFGISNNKKDAAQETATKALADSEEILLKKQAFLEKKVEIELQKAKKYCKEKNKRAALDCLKKKQYYLKQLELNDGALMKINAQRNALDSAMMNRDILNTMGTVNKALQNIHKDMNVDKVHDLMDDINEQQDIANEIATAISMPTGYDQFDEDALLEELELLNEEDVADKLLNVEGINDLPSVPAGELIASKSKPKPSKTAEEDSELANLQIFMENFVEITSDAPILLIEAFNGGSHKQLITSLERLLVETGKRVCVVTLPANKWHWRARTGSLQLAALIPRNITFGYRVLFTSSVFSLPELLALRSDLAAIPKKYIYFHENQLAYPLRGDKAADYQYAYSQVLSALAADVILFNSAYNMNSFYERLPPFLNSGLPTPPSPRIPNARRLVEELLKPKSRVLYFPVEPPPLGRILSEGILQDPILLQAERIKVRGKGPLRILWNHRWDYDKNPTDFFRVIFNLAGISVDEDFFDLGKSTVRPSVGITNSASAETEPGPLSPKETPPNFQLIVIGGTTQDTPRIFHMAKPLLAAKGLINTWGYLESRDDYWKALADSDVVVSTANHEFFGVSVVEAVSVGCVPLLPLRLAYPELVKEPNCLYRTLPQMEKQLKRWTLAPDRLRADLANVFLATYQNGESGSKLWLKEDIYWLKGLRQKYEDFTEELK
nr:glycosyltransferase domain containing protein [Hymenolepis microstoma]